MSLILVTANYCQMQNYLKDVDKETRKIIDSFQIHNSSFSSEGDLAGFQILGHLSTFQTAVHMLKEKEETASRDQSLLQGLKKFFSLPENTWRWNNNNLYYFSKQRGNWNESETFCRSYNAHLSSVLTVEEQDYLVSMKGSGGYWIGLTDAESEDNWTFVDGSGLKLSFWSNRQPDNWMGVEDCGHLTENGDWNDAGCKHQNKWICKMSLTE
ncbi:C-type lectin domain family 4 member F-like isoform X2 [Lissotriton helveticus]